MSSRLLVVDDSLVYRKMILEVLAEYVVCTAENGLKAIECLEKNDDIDIIILDLHMPEMNGFEFLNYLNEKDIIKKYTVIILTSNDDNESEIKGLSLGALDFVRKPFNADALSKRIHIHMSLIQAKRSLEVHNRMLEEIVERRTEQIKEGRDVMTSALIGLLEIRDLEASNHSNRTRHMMEALCHKLKLKDKYKTYLTSRRIEMIVKTTPLHDVGKVGVSDRILLKPGRLTDDEYVLMKKHVDFGVEALTSRMSENRSNYYIETAVKIIKDHHEWFDGSGYPEAKKADEISLEGRMMAVVDVYDALISKRVYKPAFSHEQALKMMFEERGTHFDPEVLDEFIALEATMYEIKEKYKAE